MNQDTQSNAEDDGEAALLERNSSRGRGGARSPGTRSQESHSPTSPGRIPTDDDRDYPAAPQAKRSRSLSNMEDDDPSVWFIVDLDLLGFGLANVFQGPTHEKTGQGHHTVIW